MPSNTVYRSSWDSSFSTPKYHTEHHEIYRERTSSPPSKLQSIRARLCRIFGASRPHRGQNLSSDSLAYAESNDSFEAESMDEDNIAWGRPSKHPKRAKRSRRHTKAAEGHEDDSVPSSPSSPNTASCRFWF
ncbi:hypothetical protein M0805_001861 [Coniferiporia weirii]|nr:hypothetical protein M0805_001861 [Coniferiporia weirii]